MTGLGARFGISAVLLCAAALAAFAPARADSRLDRIKARGELNCGILPDVAGFAIRNAQGRYSGFDVDTCRAIAAAILGRADKVHFVTADSVGQLRTDPDLDLVIRRLTWALTREAADGLMFGPITFYDGQGFLVPKSLGIRDVRDFEQKRICVDAGEDWSRNLIRFLKSRNVIAKLVVTGGRPDGEEQFFGGKCDAYSQDKSLLGAIRVDAPDPSAYTILPDEFSEEPLAPLVREGDDQFFQVVRWTIFALIQAERLGITSRSAEALQGSVNPDIARFLGKKPGNGKALGLPEDWALRTIVQIGNYGEIYARNLGPDSAIKLDRGRNALWSEGGLIYAPPLR